MKVRFAALSSLLTVVAILTGCSSPEESEIELRVTALEYAFNREFSEPNALEDYLFVISSDQFEKQVIASLLERYPIVSPEAIDREDYSPFNPNTFNYIDLNSGKRVIYWSIEIRKKEQIGIIWADIGCMRGGLNGYGQLLSMERSWGKWTVLFAGGSWVS